jgi:hypothetical protein
MSREQKVIILIRIRKDKIRQDKEKKSPSEKILD